MTFLVQENIASNRFNNDIISMLLETKHMREIDSMSTNEIKYFYGMLPDAHFYFCDEKSFSKKEYKAWIKNKERTTPTRKERNDYPFQPMFPTYPSLVLPATTHLKNSVQEREYLTVSDMYKGLYEKVGTMTQCTGTARRFMTKNDPAIEKAINEERIICRNSANGKEGMLANIDNPDKSIIGHVYNDNYYPFLDNNKSNNVTTRNKLSKGESVDRIRTISDKKRLIMPE